MEESLVTTAISHYQARMREIQGRLHRLLSNIPTRERELELVPAFMACQGILVLFNDQKYPFWKKPECSSPLLLSFSTIYVTICKILVESIDSYRSDVETEMKLLGDVIDDYRRRFLCFRLYKPKYPIISRKDVIDEYDENLRSTPRISDWKDFDCSCLHKQYYTLSLVETYGSFFDSFKEAILESELLSPGETPKNEWCLVHNRCYFSSQLQENCFCENWNLNWRFLQTKEEEVRRAIAASECLLTVSSNEAYVKHYQYVCKTCEFDGHNAVMCRSCKLSCHEGHVVVFVRYGWFYCDCDYITGNCKLKLVEEPEPLQLPQEITKNKDGTPVTRGRYGLHGGDTGLTADELYYCGRSMNQCRCGLCGVLCGPINGCPCDSCRELIVQDQVEYTWKFIKCNECKAVIIGERFQCKKCIDYDLCRDCILYNVHVDDNFNRMIKTAEGVEVLGVHRHIGCDGCDEFPLCGTRYKCNQCPDYNLCSKCHGTKVHEHHTFDIFSDRSTNALNQQYQHQSSKEFKLRVFRALYDHEAQDSDETSFTEGELIFEIQPIDDGWMLGLVESTGKTGMVPVNYLEHESRLRVFRAINSHEAKDSDEVSFSEGDIIFEIKSLVNNCVKGVVKRTGKTGLVPVEHLELAW
ncbi:hypothetical protein HA402_015894 [Bradysia odoriphaga]|nr:hypothetical protein HA402_015894 [Bradysia odoriphaga]